MKPVESSSYVPTRFVKSLLKLAEKRHFDINEILLNAGLDFNPLHSSSPAHISAIHYSRIYQQMLGLLQDDDFGLPEGKGISAEAFKMLCYSIIHCPTLHKAIRRITEFLAIFFSGELHLKLTIIDEKVSVSYPNMRLTESGRSKAGEAYGLALWHRFFSWLIGKPIELTEVRLLTEKPVNADSYLHLFGTTVNFSAEDSGIEFNVSYLELPLAQNEASLREFLRTAPYQMMVEPQKAETSALIANVRRVMGYDLSKGFPPFETVASALNMSAPTLRRHLRKEGISYQKLKDQCRKDAALAYLSRPELSITSVATLMGFTDPSAFHRSFKKWTGVTPGQFRSEQFDLTGSEE